MRILFLAIVAPLAGCTTMDESKELDKVKTALVAAAKGDRACYERLAADPRFSELHRRIAVDSGSLPSEAQLADSEIPSAEMKQLAMVWYSENQSCTKGTVEGFGRVDPELGIRATDWLVEIQGIYQDALENGPTFGLINARIKHLKQREIADIKEWGAGLRARLQRQQAIEDARNAQYTAAIGAVSQAAADALIVAVQILAARQSAFAARQLAYAASTPTYHSVEITKTMCTYVNRVVVCSQMKIY